MWAATRNKQQKLTAKHVPSFRETGNHFHLNRKKITLKSDTNKNRSQLLHQTSISCLLSQCILPPSPDQLRAFLKGQTGALPWGREGQHVPQLQLSYGWLGDAPLGVNAEGGLQLRLSLCTCSSNPRSHGGGKPASWRSHFRLQLGGSHNGMFHWTQKHTPSACKETLENIFSMVTCALV